MKRGQVFVRAKCTFSAMDKVLERVVYWTEWVNADVLDLDQESHNAFVLSKLFANGLLHGVKEEQVVTEHIEYRVAQEHEVKYQKIKESEDES